MLITTRRLHRILVDRLAETRWLRDRAGAGASWAHYEWHARVARSAQQRHARARAGATAVRKRHHADQHRPPRLAVKYQTAIARIVGGRRAPGGDRS